jgi:hypothetical protein
MKNESFLRILRGDDLGYSEQKDKVMISKASYDRKQQTLTLTINDQTHRYFNVPKYVFNDFAASSSYEDFFALNIEEKYTSERIA